MLTNRRLLAVIGMLAVVVVWAVALMPLLTAPTEAQKPLPTLASDPTIITTEEPTPLPDAPILEPTVSLDIELPGAETVEIPAIEVPVEPVPGVAVIRFDSTASQQSRADAISALGGNVLQQIDALNTVVIQLPEGQTLDALPQTAGVMNNEPDYYIGAQLAPPNDPLYAAQWGLEVVKAPLAWTLLPPAAQVVTVAVIDSGICADHPDLAGHIDVNGWDFVDDDNQPTDSYGHGCAVSGVIAANRNNSVGVAGVAPNARVLPLRVLDGRGLGTYSDVAAAIVYAVDNGAEIINVSLGGPNASALLEDAVNYAQANGIRVIAAAGNNGVERALYPAAYPSVVAVGAVDASLDRSSFSNYGDQVRLYAPGRDILTTTLNGFDRFSGTSLAAPYVSGVAALRMALGKDLIIDGGIVSAVDESTDIPVTVEPGEIAVCNQDEADAASSAYYDLVLSGASGTALDEALARFEAASTACAPVWYGGEFSIDGGGRNPGGDVEAAFAVFGNKWGENSPFNRQLPPATSGGTIAYSFVTANLDLSAEEGAGNAQVVPVTRLAGAATCDYQAHIREAIAVWSQVANIQFVEVDDPGTPFGSPGTDSIRIGAHVIDGATGELGHAYFPPPDPDQAGSTRGGDLHLDFSERWFCAPEQLQPGQLPQSLNGQGIDIGLVVVHEIGHALGLQHQPNPPLPAIMNPTYNINLLYNAAGSRLSLADVLQPDDKNGVRAIYGVLGLAIPVPVSPVLDAAGVPALVTTDRPAFTWQDTGATRAQYYQVEVIDSGDAVAFAANVPPAASPTVPISVTSSVSLSNGAYHWRVRGFGSLPGETPAFSDWSDPVLFNIGQGLPSLVAPANQVLIGIDNGAPRDVEFSWNVQNAAGGFTLQIDDQAEFVEPFIDSFDTADQTEVRTLPADGTFYWRVVRQDTGVVSLIRQFSIDSFTPTLNPAAITGGNNVSLTWDALEGAGEYQVQVDKSESFVGLLFLDKLFLDKLFLDKLFLDKLFLDKLFLDKLFLDKLFLDKLFLDKLFLDKLFLDKLFLDKLFLDKLFLDKLFLDKLFLDKLFLDKLFLDKIVASGTATESQSFETPFSDGEYFWRVRARKLDGSYGPWSASGLFQIATKPVNVVINEINVSDPSWIELYNAGADDADLTDYQFYIYGSGGGISFAYSFPENFTLGAGEYVVLYEQDGADTDTELYMGANTVDWKTALPTEEAGSESLGLGALAGLTPPTESAQASTIEATPVIIVPTPVPGADEAGAVGAAGDVSAQATIIVNTTQVIEENDGACSLIEAIIAANTDEAYLGCPAGAGADIIVLENGTYNIVGAYDEISGPVGLPGIIGELTIEGNTSIISRSDGEGFRFFAVTESASLTLRNLTLTGGNLASTEDNGGAIYVSSANLTLDAVNIDDNFGLIGGGIYANVAIVTISGSTFTANSAESGAAIYASGGTSLTVESTTFTNNTAFSFGGALYLEDTIAVLADSSVEGNSADSDGGGMYVTGGLFSIASLSSVSVSQNTAGDSGGGIYVDNGQLTITNGTLAGNAAADGGGGGIYLNGGEARLSFSTVTDNNGAGIYNFEGTAQVTNSIIARQNSNDDCIGFIEVFGTSFDTDESCGDSESVGVGELQLGTLANNGGSTRTVALGDSSAAIDALPDCETLEGLTIEIDQRGFTRPFGSACDAGAYEAGEGVEGGETFIVTTTDITDDGVCNAANCTIIEAINAANNTPGLNTVQLGSNRTFTLTAVNNPGTDGDNGLPKITGDMILTGVSVRINRDGSAPDFRLFEVTSTGSLTLSNLVLAFGSAQFGGGIFNAGETFIRDSNLSGFTASNTGAAIYNLGTLNIGNSRLESSTADGVAGAAIYSASGTVDIQKSAISLNTGSGIFNSVGELEMINVTVSGNTGSGVQSEDTANLSFVTLANNGSFGFEQFSGQVGFKNSIIANNAGGDCNGLLDLSAAAGNFTTDDSCGLPVVTSEALALGPLNFNNSIIPTHMLRSGSVAIDSAPDCNGLSGATIVEDARSVARPRGAACDPGAHEFDGALTDVPQTGPTFTVNTAVLDDDGICGVVNCSLIEAINAANAIGDPNTIDFSVSGAFIFAEAENTGENGGNGLPVITTNITIGTGRRLERWSVTPEQFRIFEIAPSGSLTLNGMVVNLGYSGDNPGGNILNFGTLTINDSVIASGTSIFSGGGITNFGTLTITNSTLSNNQAPSAGALDNQGTLLIEGSTLNNNRAISNDGGAIFAGDNTTTIINSTLTGNSAIFWGGAVVTGAGAPGDTTVNIINSTIAENTSTLGGAVSLFQGSINLTNTIVANNTGGNCSAEMGNNGGNIQFPGAGCGAFTSADPLLGTLTSTPAFYPLAAGSPAIDLGVADDCPAVDQRGVARPQGAACDAGSYEVDGEAPVVNLVVTTLDDTEANDGLCSLREAVNAADSGTPSGNQLGECVPAPDVAADTITFAESILPGTIALDDDNGEIVVSSEVTIDGDSAMTISGNNSVRVFYVCDCGNLTLRDLRLIDGDSDDGDGSAITTFGRVVVENVSFETNNATSQGGAIVAVGLDANLTVRGSSFFGNTSDVEAGAIYAEANATVTIIDSSFDGNSGVTFGGAMAFRDSDVTITNTFIDGNSAASAGGIYSENGSLTITGSVINFNIADGTEGGGDGGGVYVTMQGETSADLFIRSTTIRGNQAPDNGGGIFADTFTDVEIINSDVLNNTAGGGGGIFSNGDMLLLNTTVGGNNAPSGGGIVNGGSLTIDASDIIDNAALSNDGGGILSYGEVTITNSTFFGNSAAINGGALVLGGEGPVNINHSTLTGNSAINGGGLATFGGLVSVTNSIVADNIDAAGPSNANCGPNITDGGGNIQFPGAECPGFTTADPLLSAPVQGNNLFFLLGEGSPAVDNADNDFCPAKDIRGLYRPFGESCDSGSVEMTESGAVLPNATGGGVALVETGETRDFVRFGDSNTAPIDTNDWRGTNVLLPDVGSGQTIGRDPWSSDTNHYSDWARQNSTRGGQNSTRALINEVFTGSDAIELHNPLIEAVDLSNWEVLAYDAEGSLVEADPGDGYTYKFAPGTKLSAGAYLILREGAGTNSSGVVYMGVDVPWADWNASGAVALTNSISGVDFMRFGDGGAQALFTVGALAVADVQPPDGTGWQIVGTPVPSPLPGESIGRDAISTDTDRSSDWYVLSSSLGEANPLLPPPSNDEYRSAIVINQRPFRDAFNLLGATNVLDPIAAPGELEPEASCGIGVTRTVWYSFTSDTATTLRLQTDGSDFETVLSVWTETNGDLAEVLCSLDNGTTPRPRLTLSAAAGVTYYIQVGGNLNGGGTFVFSVDAPENDDFDDALAVTALPFADVQNTTAASHLASDPQPACVNEPVGRSVWYSFTAASDAPLRLFTGDPLGAEIGSDFDTVISVWVGARDALTQAACSDDDATETTSDLIFTPVAGTTYYVMVAGAKDGGGQLRFYMSEVEAPDNDTPETAHEVTADGDNTFSIDGQPSPFLQDTTGATDATGEPVPTCGLNVGATVWFRYEALTDDTVIFQTFGSDYDTSMSLYIEEAGALVEQPCGEDYDDAGVNTGSRILLETPTVGTVYYVAVGGYFGETGVLQLSVFTPQVEPPANDPQANPQPISSIPFAFAQDTTGATKEGANEPIPTCGDGAHIDHTVWFSYTADANRRLAFTTALSDYDTVMTIWIVANGQLVQIACNDDANNTLQSELILNTGEANTFLVQIGGYKGDRGNLRFGVGEGEIEVPTVTIDADPVTVAEGQIATNSGTFSAPAGETVTLVASIGQITQNPNGTFAWEYLTSDGPAQSGGVTITAISAGGGQASADFTLNVTNVAPTATFFAASYRVNQATLTFIDPLDPSAPDTAAGFAYSYDCDGDGLYEAANIAATAYTCQYISAAQVTVGGRIADKDGGFTDYRVTVIPNGKPLLITPFTRGECPAGPTSDSIRVTNIGFRSLRGQVFAEYQIRNRRQIIPGTFTSVNHAGPADYELTLNYPPVSEWPVFTNTSTGQRVAMIIVTVQLEVLDASGNFIRNPNGSVLTLGPGQDWSIYCFLPKNALSVSANQLALSAPEGTTAVNSGIISDKNAQLSASLGEVVNNGDGTWSWSMAAEDGPQPAQQVKITAQAAGKSAEATFSLTVNNVPPTASFGAGVGALSVGETATVSFSDQADPGPLDSAAGFTYSYDCDGDGVYELESSTSDSFSCPYDGPGIYQVKASIADKDAGATGYSTSVTVTGEEAPTPPAAPVLTVMTPGLIQWELAGSTVSNSGTVSDPAAVMTASEGTLINNGDGTWRWSGPAEDGPADSADVIIMATNAGGSTSLTFNVIVDNSPPVATFSNMTGAVTEGDSAILALTNAQDHSAVDTAAGFLYSFDCAGDGTFEIVDSLTPAYPCVYPAAGSFTAIGRIADKDGMYSTYSLSVTVNPAPTPTPTPTPTPLPNTPPVANPDTASVEAGNSVAVNVLLNDYDADGDPLAVISFTQGLTGAVSLNPDGTLTYASDNNYSGADTFSYSISDGRGGTASAAVVITVTPVPPPVLTAPATRGYCPAEVATDTLTVTGLRNRQLRGQITLSYVAEAGVVIPVAGGSYPVNHSGPADFSLTISYPATADWQTNAILVDVQLEVYGADGQPVINPDGSVLTLGPGQNWSIFCRDLGA